MVNASALYMCWHSQERRSHMSFALFLDVDGVLNTRTTVVGAPSGRTGIDESRVRLLKKALKQFGDAEIVLTSDWKLMREDGDDFSYLVSMLG